MDDLLCSFERGLGVEVKVSECKILKTGSKIAFDAHAVKPYIYISTSRRTSKQRGQWPSPYFKCGDGGSLRHGVLHHARAEASPIPAGKESVPNNEVQ